MVRWTVARRQLDGVDTSVFFPHGGKKTHSSPFWRTIRSTHKGLGLGWVLRFLSAEVCYALLHFHQQDDIMILHQVRYLSLGGLLCRDKGLGECARNGEIVRRWGLWLRGGSEKRNIYTPRDLMLVSHKEYEEKWNRFCNVFHIEAEAL